MDIAIISVAIFAGFIASMLVFLKACERSEPATPTLVATSSFRLLLVSLAARFACCSSSKRLTHLLCITFPSKMYTTSSSVITIGARV